MMKTDVAMRDVLHTPYVLGGREIGAGLDCLGVVSIIARRRGLPPPDGWPSIRAAWERGELPTATGFPIGWRRQQPIRDLRDGDVLLYFGPEHPWSAIVHNGHVWSASPEVGGVFSMPASRWNRVPDELWRFEVLPA
jgi:hypothetical protein